MINFLNHCGERGVGFATEMLIQSSLLITVLMALDWAIKSRARAVFRYSLGLLVLVKLVLPPSFAAPTGLGYWLAQENHSVPAATTPSIDSVPHFSQPTAPTELIAPAAPTTILHHPTLTLKGAAFILWLAGMAILILWLAHRLRFISKMVRTASEAPPSLNNLLQECATQLAINRSPKVKICQSAQSPALCGIFHPTILIPARLVQQLTASQTKAVLLHELVHFKRHDLLVNFAQTLLQVAYWWHPLLWLANSHLQRLREEAVDETVMVSMQKDADIYPETLLTVAKFAFTRPLLTLGMVGIIESKSALKHRIRRVIEMEIPQSEKLHPSRAVLIAALAALLLPMAQAAPKITTMPATKKSGQFQIEFKYVVLPRNGSINTAFPTSNFQTNWVHEPIRQFFMLSSPIYTLTDGQQTQIEVPDGPKLKVTANLAEHRIVALEKGFTNVSTATVTLEATIQNKQTPNSTRRVTETFSTLSEAAIIVPLETNTPGRQYLFVKTTILNDKESSPPFKSGIPVTAMKSFSMEPTSSSFPVVTGALVEKQIASDGGKFTIDTAEKILKEIEYAPGKTVGFDRTFLDRFQDKGPTLFMAGAMVIAGNENHVTGVVEPVSSKSKTRTRTFHVDFKLFHQNVEARRSKNLSPYNITWPDIFKSLLEEAGLDCDSGNKLSFNEAKGELTIADSQNIDTVERIVLDLNQPSDKTMLWLPVLLNQQSILTEAQFIETTDAAFAKLQIKPEPRKDHQIGDFYLLNSEDFAKAQDYLSANGSVLSRPRLQSASGIESSLYTGDANSSVELGLINYILGKKMKMTVLGRTTGTFSTKSSDWPDGAGQTNVAIYAQVPTSTNGGVLFRVRNSTTNPTNNLALLLKVSVVK